MYIKISCTHCGERAYHSVSMGLMETKTGLMLEKVEVTDTISEEDLIRLISNFVSKNWNNGIKMTKLSKFLTDAFGISPQFVPDIEGKIQWM